MSIATIEHILEEIGQLSDEDRRLFDEKLAQLNEAEWEALTKEAARIADERGIDEDAIDRAVERVRYGKSKPAYNPRS